MIILPSSMMRISYTRIIFYTSFRCYKILAPLKISAALMAMAELNVNVQGEYGLWTNLVKQGYAEGQEGPAWGHTLVFSPLDNLARRGSSGY